MSPASVLTKAIASRRIRRRGLILLACIAGACAAAFIWERLHHGDAASSIEATTQDWQRTNRSMP